MRHSIALLAHTPVRLAELAFPFTNVHVHRTRIAFVHLDNLLHFAKIDRDGRVDGFVAAYLPDEVALLFLKQGELATAVAFTTSGRRVLPIATALRQIRHEPERGELVFCDAPLPQLTWMYGSCAAPAQPRPASADRPAQAMAVLRDEGFSGIAELIVDGQVNYVRLENGEYADGYFVEPAAGTPREQVERLFEASDRKPQVTVSVFALYKELPVQASPALIQIYRDIFWSVVAVAEREVPDAAQKRARRLADSLSAIHTCLRAIGVPPDRVAVELVTTPNELTHALSDWALQLLEELEVIAPGVAPVVLADATREHRFLLQKAQFYGRLPWSVSW